MFSQIDFGELQQYIDSDDITDISYDNGGQIHLKTLSRGIFRIENDKINNAFMEKLAFQCSNVMGKTFNMASPFLDAEGSELRLNFVHESIAKNGIACVIRKTPAKIRLEKEKLLQEKYVDLDIHDFLVQCVLGHCNIIACGETGSGKTEFIKYLASKTKEDEKLITIEDTLELHLDKIFPHRDIVTMKTNNIASYSDVLVTCMRQNPKWILLSEVRSAEAVMAVRNSISSGHYILSTIHADKASSIPNRLYSLLESSQDMDQFMKSIYRYIQIGVYIRGYQDKKTKRFIREIAEVTEFYVTEDNDYGYNEIYKKTTSGNVVRKKPTKYLLDYLDRQGIVLDDNAIVEGEKKADFSMQAAENQSSETVKTTIEQSSNVQKPVSVPVQNNIVGQTNHVQNIQKTNVQENVQVKNVQPVNQPINVQPVQTTQNNTE